jgi:enhancing lycopene biosynthesis protein 2
MNKKIALILSGCGQRDGSEIQETVLSLLALNQANMDVDAFAPNISQEQVFDHLHNCKEEISRNVLVESARIMRGKIKPIEKVTVESYDGIVIPGGGGVISNLCNYAEKGINFTLESNFKKFIFAAVENNKPIVFICIAPVMIPKIYPNRKPKMTIGNDLELAKQMESLGGVHIVCPSTQAVVDKENKIISTPANMILSSISEVYQGICMAIEEMQRLM